VGQAEDLIWDGTGMLLIDMGKEQGNFAWPKVQDGTVQLSRAQFDALFEGFDCHRQRQDLSVRCHRPPGQPVVSPGPVNCVPAEHEPG